MVQVSGEFEDTSARPLAFETWAERLPVALESGERALLERAWQYASEHLGDRYRRTGESFLSHAVAVASIVGGLKLDRDTLVASLLHDLPWFEGFDADALARTFGDDVATLVDGTARMAVVSDLHPDPRNNDSGDRVEALRKMLLAMARDIRVVFIVLAERLHDMRAMKALDEAECRAIARETQDLHAPLANRLGIWQIKWELEDLCFRYLDPVTYKRIAKLLAEKRVDRERYIAEVRDELAAALDNAGVVADVAGRPKHIYSIWRKMQRKGLGFHELFDIRAVRVLVNDVAQCYAALGVVHALWQPIPREFDDYIATPKDNNYQSLHTAVVGPEGKNVEIQIRTKEMHQQAELGVAAHWRYKEGVGSDPSFDQKVAWLRQLLEAPADDDAEDDLIDRFKAEVFEDRVYVITPQGDVIDLPRGATPLDFAYQVHTEIGHRCRGAKINGRIVPLTTELRNGDQIEVLTAREPRPSRDWLNPARGYLRTPRARAKARAWFKRQDFDHNAAEGRQILDRELHRLGLTGMKLDQIASRAGYEQLDGLLAAIGRGDISGGQIAGLVSDHLLPAGDDDDTLPVKHSHRTRQAGRDDDVTIYGVGNLLTRMAGCCQPAPGDAIIGFITQGQGVTVHRQDCEKVQRFEEAGDERLIEVSWASGQRQRYPVAIQVEAFDRQGLMKDITAVLTQERINVTATNTRADPDEQLARMTLTLEVQDVSQMSRVMDRVAGLRNVRDVRRVPSG
jgi:GTP pyrophosphokinase